MAELGGGDWKLSTVPAFTEAAHIALHETSDQPSNREGETGETKKNSPAFRPTRSEALIHLLHCV